MLPSGGRGFYDARSEMNRLFDEIFGGLGRRSSGQQRTQGAAEWAPAIDVVQDQGKRSSHGQGKLNRLNSTSRMAAMATACGRERMGFTPPYLLLEAFPLIS